LRAMEIPDYHRDFGYLRELLKPNIKEDELLGIGRAYEVAEAAHLGQMRDEGTPYILHPLRVAILMAEELKIYSPKLLCAALLHDVIEDTEITRDQIAEMFGGEVSRIVWLLTKFYDVSLPAYLAAIEAAADTGALTIKLCDRLDNLRFLVRSPKVEKKRRYIKTTEQYYVPLAVRFNTYLYDQLCHSLEEARGHVAKLSSEEVPEDDS
jgi:guanosine-3',5'-bis(diphosphate) 3'-pyrophosphohydrolase